MDENKKEFKLKRDRYMSARGGTSTFYNIYCAKCRHWLLLYQKDGRGNLFRLYLDRIHDSIGKTGRSNGLMCHHCGASIGIPMIYKPENRSALRLVPGTIVKKRSDGVLPAPPTTDSKEDINENSPD